MPDVTPTMIHAVADYLKYYPVTTLFTEMTEEEQLKPSTVKMVRSGDTALWFGRGITGYGDWHLGIYGYRADALSLYPSLEVTQEERVEKLEQLRWLKAGWTIGCTKVDFNGVEINTQEDIHLWNYKNEQVQDRSVGITQNQTI
jgi:CMP-2-keto-3-deoxyoctulosonic acid synthetase